MTEYLEDEDVIFRMEEGKIGVFRHSYTAENGIEV